MKLRWLVLFVTVSALGARTSLASQPSGAASTPHAQVLIEALILQVPASSSNGLGTSYLTGEAQAANDASFGAGVLSRSNLHSITEFANVTGTNAVAGQPSGFEYLASPGTDLDAMMPALASDSRVRILQRPRIQTSDGESASLFVGESRPYPTSHASRPGASADDYGKPDIEQLLVGVTFEVTPAIKPDGTVVLDIHQKIDRVVGSTNIVNVGEVPITTSIEAQAKVAVRDRETLLLGGLIETVKTWTPSGVPLLKGIPLLGGLFRSSSARTEQNECIVLIRPTILPAAETAAAPERVKND